MNRPFHPHADVEEAGVMEGTPQPLDRRRSTGPEAASIIRSDPTRGGRLATTVATAVLTLAIFAPLFLRPGTVLTCLHKIGGSRPASPVRPLSTLCSSACSGS